MRGHFPTVHSIEDAIIWQSDGTPIEEAIGFWVRQWRRSIAETVSTANSTILMIGNAEGSSGGSEDGSGSELEPDEKTQEEV